MAVLEVADLYVFHGDVKAPGGLSPHIGKLGAVAAGG